MINEAYIYIHIHMLFRLVLQGQNVSPWVPSHRCLWMNRTAARGRKSPVARPTTRSPCSVLTCFVMKKCCFRSTQCSRTKNRSCPTTRLGKEVLSRHHGSTLHALACRACALQTVVVCGISLGATLD